MKREVVDNDQSGRVYEDFQPGAGWIHYSDSNTLLVDLPGFKNIEQLRLDTDRNLGYLDISGERHLASNKWKRFRKVLRIPKNSNSDEIRARLEGGVLYVTIPKIIPPPKQQPPPAPSQESKIGELSRTVTIKEPKNVESVQDPETEQEDSPAAAKTPAPEAVPFMTPPSREPGAPVTRELTFKEPAKVDAVEDPESDQEDSPATAETIPAPESAFESPPSSQEPKAPVTRKLTFKEPTIVDTVEDPEAEQEDSPAPWSGPVRVLLEKKVVIAFSMGVGFGAFLGCKLQPRGNKRNSN